MRLKVRYFEVDKWLTSIQKIGWVEYMRGSPTEAMGKYQLHR